MRKGILLFVALAVLCPGASRAAPCYVAYVHGKLSSTPGSSGPSNLTPGSGATDADRRNYWRHDQSLPLRDNVRGVSTSYFPGSYVGSFGLALQ